MTADAGRGKRCVPAVAGIAAEAQPVSVIEPSTRGGEELGGLAEDIEAMFTRFQKLERVCQAFRQSIGCRYCRGGVRLINDSEFLVDHGSIRCRLRAKRPAEKSIHSHCLLYTSRCV